MLKAVVLAAALVFATGAMAAPAPTPAPADSEAYVNGILQELGVYATAHQGAITEANDLVLLVLSGSEKAIDLHEAGARKAEAKAWADGWEREVRARIAAVRASQSRLPPFPDSAFKRLVAMAPEMASRRAGYEKIPVHVGETLDLSIAFAENSIGLAERVAAGDDAALQPLGAEIVRATKLMLGAENAMFDISIAMGTPDHPQTELSRSMKASNQAIEIFMDHQIAVILEGDSSAAEAGAKMRAQAQIARASAVRTSERATRTTAELAAMPDMQLKQRILAMVATYHESSKVEVQIADALLLAADKLAAGDASEEQMSTLLEPLDALVDRRVEIATRRLGLLKP